MSTLEKLYTFAWRDLGLLVMRLGLGASIMRHGYQKYDGGPEVLEGVGKAMAFLGLDFAPQFWGTCAMLSELVGGFLLAIGLLTRFSAASLVITMFTAAWMHYNMSGGAIDQASHPFELGIAFFGLMLLGPGKFSLDRKLL